MVECIDMTSSQNKQEIILLSSFPRSGNTWLRLLLTDLFLLLDNRKLSQEEVLSISDLYIPDMHCHDINSESGISKYNLLPIKTHSKFNEVAFKSNKVILLYRNPADCLISYYYYLKAQGKIHPHDEQAKDSFALSNIQDWIDFYESYLNSKISVTTVSYENLHTNPERILAKIMETIGIRAPIEIYAKSVERNKFSNYRGKWRLSDAGNPNNYFFRKGETGEGVKEFSQNCLNALHSAFQKTLDRLKYLENNLK